MSEMKQVNDKLEPPPVELPCCNDCGEEVGELNDSDRCDACQEDYYTCDACSDEIHIDEVYWSPSDTPHCDGCFGEYYAHCDRCEYLGDRDYMYWNEDRDEYLCENCDSECQANCVDNFNNNLSLPSNTRTSTTFNKLDIKRYVGIEAECQYPSDVESLSNPLGWTHCHDGSIHSDEGYSGTEMVSTPANGDSLYASITNLTQWSYNYEAKVNRSCGLHIHFNSLDLSAREIAFIGIVYKVLESSIFNMMPPSRRKSNWCKKFPINTDNLKRIAKDNCEQSLVDYYYDGYYPSTEKYNDCRYYGLNLHARYYHGTIEFRHHSGTLNKTKILNWIKICNAIIEKGIHLSKEKTPTKLNKFMYRDSNTQRQLRYVLGSELLEYVNKRTTKFITEGDNNE